MSNFGGNELNMLPIDWRINPITSQPMTNEEVQDRINTMVNDNNNIC